MKIECDGLSFVDGSQEILKDITFSVEKGDSISIVGRSGSGKSTLLKIIGSLMSPTAGRLLYEGKPYESYTPTELRKKIAYCFQTPYLFGDTVRENLAFPYVVRGETYEGDHVSSWFSRFEMNEALLDKNPSLLSGGEKQRIALIRSLLFMPDVLLLDEVTSALDVENTRIVENVIAKIHEQGTTILWVTHNLDQSMRFATQQITLDGGRIIDRREK